MKAKVPDPIANLDQSLGDQDVQDPVRALAESEERFRKFAEIATDWYWETDADLRFTFVSRNVVELGVTQESIIGKTLGEVRHDTHDLGDFAEEVKALRARKPYRGIERRSTVNPGYWLSVSGQPQFDEAGNFTGYCGVTTDITERKLAEFERENNEALLRAIIDNLPVALLVKDLEGRNTLLNKTFREWYGVSSEEALGKVNIGLFGTMVDDADIIDVQERHVIETGETTGRETVRRLADGEDHFLSINKYPLRDVEGAVSGVVSVSADLTERVKASQALSESEGRFREFAEIASDWLWEMDEDLRFIYVSSRYTEITGVAVADVMGKTRQELSVDGIVGEVWERHLDDLKHRRPFRDFRYRGLTPDGRVVICSVSGNPYFDAAGQFRGYRGTTTDVTKYEELNRLKSEFVSTASHELRTPLTSIHGALRLISSGALGAVPEKIRELLDIAVRNSEHLTLLINDLLDLQRIESGTIEIRREPVDLCRLVEQAIDTNRTYADQFEVSLSMKKMEPEAWIEGDAERLKQVLANLFSNAIKFSPEGSPVEASVLRRGGLIRVEVVDQGPGVPEAFHDSLFEKFTQADGSDNRQINGTGLGLSISKAIIDEHGGHIDFVSTEGQGAKFYFDLPGITAPSDKQSDQPAG
ncbi:MAG: PAS domain-containing sensor histidine kinase [Rhodospirillaceae bacterium]|nr:PAS domain-containing sensor histidine kinase [Rhodospirillaceae bacterium]MDD9926535.1 PAS domain-containing sensor histidine kinase [Rhodospirillaceae bacterium]